MQVGPFRQGRRVDLDHRADQDDRAGPIRVGQSGDQLVIEPLVDGPVIAEDRPGQIGNVIGHRHRRVEGPGEVSGLDGRGEAVDVRVPVALRLVEAPPAREDDVGPLQEPRLGLAEARRGAGEVGQLVHAVIDNNLIVPEPLAIRCEHRRVEPPDGPPIAPRHPDVILDQGPEVVIDVRRSVGPEHGHPRRDGDHVQPGRATVEGRLLLDDHRPVPREPTQQVLRTLIHPILRRWLWQIRIGRWAFARGARCIVSAPLHLWVWNPGPRGLFQGPLSAGQGPGRLDRSREGRRSSVRVRTRGREARASAPRETIARCQGRPLCCKWSAGRTQWSNYGVKPYAIVAAMKHGTGGRRRTMRTPAREYGGYGEWADPSRTA